MTLSAKFFSRLSLAVAGSITFTSALPDKPVAGFVASCLLGIWAGLGGDE